MANAVPDSWIPRRFAAVSSRIAVGERDLVLGDEWHGRSDVGHRRGHRHGDGQHVVDQQCAGDRQTRCRPRFVVTTVVATARRIRVHILSIRRNDNQHH